MSNWEGLAFIQECGTQGSPRFHLFVSDVDQQRNKGA